MSAPVSEPTSAAIARLNKDYLRLMHDPVPYVNAHPLPSNILEWHYAILGPEDTLYEGGVYHGKLVFPNNFPFSPPSIFMITPNGRFECNVRLCLSMSDFHPDTWNASWTVATILTGLLSFMIETAATKGSIETSDDEKKMLATRSLQFNLEDEIFCELFPNLVEESKQKISGLNNLSTSNSSENATDAGPKEVLNLQIQEVQAPVQAPVNALTRVAFVVGFAALFVLSFGYIVSII